LLAQADHDYLRFGYGRLGEITIPAEIWNARRKEWRFFKWFS